MPYPIARRRPGPRHGLSDEWSDGQEKLSWDVFGFSIGLIWDHTWPLSKIEYCFEVFKYGLPLESFGETSQLSEDSETRHSKSEYFGFFLDIPIIHLEFCLTQLPSVFQWKSGAVHRLLPCFCGQKKHGLCINQTSIGWVETSSPCMWLYTENRLPCKARQLWDVYLSHLLLHSDGSTTEFSFILSPYQIIANQDDLISAFKNHNLGRRVRCGGRYRLARFYLETEDERFPGIACWGIVFLTKTPFARGFIFISFFNVFFLLF